MSTSVNPKEIAHFAKDSARWWDEDGPFRPLHMMNGLRMRHIRNEAERHFGLDPETLQPFQGIKILDIGCGGGLVCEPLARLGGSVTGIDADAQAISVAAAHADQAGLDIRYLARSAETLVKKEAGSFNMVTALEIVEHVTDLDDFLQSAANLCKPGGLVILSTLNRTTRSFLLGIVAAEHILRWVPQGTHQWSKFIKPSELAASLRRTNLAPSGMKGYIFNPLKGEFELSDRDHAVNYFMSATKPDKSPPSFTWGDKGGRKP